MYYNTIVLETEYDIAFLAIGEICVSTRNQIYLKLGPQLYVFADDRLVPVKQIQYCINLNRLPLKIDGSHARFHKNAMFKSLEYI
jgi:hypothetical protein